MNKLRFLTKQEIQTITQPTPQGTDIQKLVQINSGIVK